MTIVNDLIKHELPAYIELFDINALTINAQYYRFTTMVNGTSKVAWGGHTYDPFPLAISGIEQHSTGAPSRPQLSVANVDRFFGTLVQTMEDMVGAEVTYRRTFANYLNTYISAAPMRFLVNRKLSHNKTGVVFELKFFMDMDKLYLPKRQMLRDSVDKTGKDNFPGLGINKRTS